MNTKKIITINTDGGARGNPGPAAWAFVVKSNTVTVHSHSGFLGETTNNVAEYQGVIAALRWIGDNVSQLQFPVSVYLDSLLVVQQLNGKYKIKQPHLQKLWQEAKSIERNIGGTVLFQHVPRHRNADADALVNQTLDARV